MGNLNKENAEPCLSALEDGKEVCPMILVNKILSGKWKILILWYLSNEPLRFSDLKRKLPNVTQKMLTTQLRNLEEDNLVYRKVYSTAPPKVEYGLTKLGEMIKPVLKSMHDYGNEYMDYINNKN
ncbi:helix-turn-helix domain-containing protein [Clostridium sp.]|uniref:winged helix-turn-helix transcriptional regulator n=1 Tax=Clostridium sp. TaxID=1506 RepID=UPI00262CC15B|nr:helix-turn-helix domain-containing protein [Clostridium sp.]